VWSFLRIRNSKLSKKIAEANLAHLPKLHVEKKTNMYNFANKGCNVMFVVIQFIKYNIMVFIMVLIEVFVNA